MGSSGADDIHAAASNGSSGLYVCGDTHGDLGGPNAGGADAWVARYDAAGNQVWIRQFGTSTNDVALAAAPDGSGGVYVCGWTIGSLGGPFAGGSDPWLARYDGAGNRTWIRQFGMTAHFARASVAAPDGSGGVYVSGQTSGGSLGGPPVGITDTWLARYDGAGNRTWIRQFGTSGSYALPSAAASDGSGGVYVSGDTGGSLGGPHAGVRDVWIARYDGAGSRTWIRQIGTSEPTISTRPRPARGAACT